MSLKEKWIWNVTCLYRGVWKINNMIYKKPSSLPSLDPLLSLIYVFIHLYLFIYT